MIGRKTMDQALRPTADAAWVLGEEGHDPLRESSHESRFAISNGFLGVRGARAATGGCRWAAPARTYVAGLFDTSAADGAIPELVPAADWLRVRILLDGKPLVDDPGDLSSHSMTLDMRRGVLLTECLQMNAPAVGVRLRTLRLASQSERSIGLQLIQLDIDHGEVEVSLEASFEGMNLGLVAERIEQDLGVWRTPHSRKGLAMATAPSLQVDGEDLPATALGGFKWSWTWASRPGQVACFARLVALTRSDAPEVDPGIGAKEKLGAVERLGWREIVADHESAWANRWRCSDVEVEGAPVAQQALRFAIYHLNSAANPADERVSIGARALTGDDYRGHVFWDTEIFLLPFYALTWPEAARALLIYRHRTLNAARAKAARMGWRGALYAWESADTGDEATPAQVIGPDRKVVDVLSGTQEQHISADVAYAVWRYWQATGDEPFLLDFGAEILLETARFWASRAKLEADGRHHIRGVVGPDEYHENIDDNAFTNLMARWNIGRALDVAALVRERWSDRWTQLSSRLGLEDDELTEWRAVADTMATGIDPASGLVEQFAGFFGLEKIDLADYAGRSVPMDVVLGRERTQRSQVIKQADVVALLALLPDQFVGDAGAGNFGYYEPRCGHGSSLSRAMHGLAAARLGETELALRYFHETAAIDLTETHAAIAGGVHIAALGGLWQIAVLGFAGLSMGSDGVAIDPKLPENWRNLAFSVQWHGRQLRLRIAQAEQSLDATLEAGEPMTLVVCGKPYVLRRDGALHVALRERQNAAA